MSTPKGYSSQEKEDRLSAEFVTVAPVTQRQFGLDVSAHEWVATFASDVVEASSTTSVINATAHVALRGDVIAFTSGALQGIEVSVYSVTANTITLAETLSSAPAAAVTFDILKYTRPKVSALGAVVSAMTFVRDGASQTVTEDTITPANNRPLPVKLTDVTGDLTITANNLDVQMTHAGASPDSIQVGDGTEILLITAAGEANVRSAQLPAALGQTTIAASTSVTLASDQPAVTVTMAASLGRTKIELIRNDYVGTPVTTGAYVQLVAATSGIINQLHIFDSSGETLVLATGAAAAEVDQFYIPPGGLNATMDLNIAAGTRLSVKAISANATVGELVITALS